MDLRRLLAGAVVMMTSGALAAGCGSSERVPSERQRIAYGDHPDAFGDLWMPVESDAPVPVVVLIHGGFWRDGYFLDLMDPLVPSLLDRGLAVWNIEYRRVGAGGGYPQTFDDVAAALDALASLPDGRSADLDLDRVAVVGHSAGGHLAVWSASRSVLPAGAVGAAPVVAPRLAIAQAGVLDLVGCAEQGVGVTACPDLLGGSPSDLPDRYAQTSPNELVPIDATVVAVHGTADTIVPISQSSTYVAAAAAAGQEVAFREIVGADHFAHIDPLSAAWAAALDALDALNQPE